MRPSTLWNWIHRLLGWCGVCFGVLSAVLAAALKADVTWVTQWWVRGGDALVWLQNVAWVGIPFLILFLGFAKVLRDAIGPPWVWTVVQRVLDQFQELAFADRSGPKHHHRVTLFRIARFSKPWRRWPGRRYLVPVARSGHATMQCSVVFRIPDSADNAEGVAGRTWAERKVVPVSGLPAITGAVPDEVRHEYARKTWVSRKWLRAWAEPAARSFLGIPVEVGGKPWGVIVLDSRDERPIGQRTIRTYNMRLSSEKVGASCSKGLRLGTLSAVARPVRAKRVGDG